RLSEEQLRGQMRKQALGRTRGEGAAPAAAPAAGGMGMAGAAMRLAAPARDSYAAIDAAKSVESAAQASSVGELFRYEIAAPVKLERGKSAMLPIVNEAVQGEKVSIYNEQSQVKHPLNGLRLKNSTDLH